MEIEFEIMDEILWKESKFQSLTDRLFTLEYLAEKYPKNLQILLDLASCYFALSDYDNGYNTLTEASNLDPQNSAIKSAFTKISVGIQGENKCLQDLEEFNKNLPNSSVFYRWSPIKPLPQDILEKSFKEVEDKIQKSWFLIKSDKMKLEAFLTYWACERSKIENLYDFSDDLTKSLMSLGFLSSLLEGHEVKNSLSSNDGISLARLLESQKIIVMQVMERVAQQKKELQLISSKKFTKVS